MIRYEDFGSNVEAHLTYAAGLPLEDQIQILSRRLEDESWKAAPAAWTNALARLAYSHDPPLASLAVLRADLVAHLLQQPFEGPGMERVVHEVLPRLIEADLRLTDVETQQLVGWFVQQAGPGKASLAADILGKVYAFHRHDAELPERWCLFHPLAEWLILNGSAELRSKRRADLVLDLVLATRHFGTDPQLLVHTLRYLALHDHGLHPPRYHFREPTWDRIFEAVEYALCQEAPASLVKDLILARPEAVAAETVRVLLDPPPEQADYPRVRAALTHALFRGALTGKAALEGWQAAFWSPFPTEPIPNFRSAEALDAALEALNRHSAFGQRHQNLRRQALSPDNARAWARYLATEAIRVHGLSAACDSTTNPYRLARLSAFEPNISLGIRDAVYAAIVAAPDAASYSLARAILEEAPTAQSATIAALKALPREIAPRPEGPPRAFLLDRLRNLLLSLLHQPWTEPVFGIDLAKLLGSATSIDLVDLEREDSVRFVAGGVQVDRRSLANATDLPWEDEARLAHGVLYFFHEVIHRAQGIHARAMVDPLHAAGAESTLLHVDLGADHGAALLAARAVPRWSLTWLKDLQGRSLINFPAGRFHSPAARARKAQRLVGLRLDYLARVSDILPAEVVGEGYLFSDFGPAGGAFLVLRSGPPVALVGAGTLTSKEAALLSAAADEEPGHRQEPDEAVHGDRLARLDQLLRRQLEQVARVRT